MKDTYQALEDRLQAKKIQEEKTSFTFNGEKHDAYFAFDPEIHQKKPGIIVVPEWWGLNEYARERGKMLAALGYVAMSIDVFGKGTIAKNPQEAMACTRPFGADPSLCKGIVDTAILKFKTLDQLDSSNIAIIGYCFGGYVAINAGIMGSDVKAVVGFHPSLGVGKPVGDVRARFLICAGADDEFEKDHVQPFKQKMDAAGIHYIFNSYPDARHAFTNPNSTENARNFGIPVAYNAAADSASWQDMEGFFKEVFHKGK